MATASCATQPVRTLAVEIQGLDAFPDDCESVAVATDAEIEALAAMTAEEREEKHWIPRDRKLRAFGLCQQARANGMDARDRAHNETIRAHNEGTS